MCMVDKEWPKVKEESELVVKQMKSLMTAFLNVESEKTRENLVEFFQTLCKLANSQNGQKIIQTINKDKRKINKPPYEVYKGSFLNSSIGSKN